MAFVKPSQTSHPRSYPTLSKLILERIADAGKVALSSFFPARYPEARLWRSLLGLDATYRFQRETFASLLSRLQNQGLVVRTGRHHQSFWQLTTRGKIYMNQKSEVRKIESDGIGRLVIFDIPEKERRKRDTIRMELIGIGFQQLQKSVWYGEHPLPRDFITLIDSLSLQPHVHIFSVRQSGTITKR